MRNRATKLGLVGLFIGVVAAGCGKVSEEEIEEEDGSAPPPTGRDAAAPTGRDAGPEAAPPDTTPPDTLPPLPLVTFMPAQTTFVDSLNVSLRASHPGAAIYYTIDDKPPTKMSTAYKDPIPVTRSTVVRAFAIATDGMEGPVANRSFLKLDPSAAMFSSNLGVVVTHSAVARPTTKAMGYRPGTFTLFAPDPMSRRVTLMAAPSVSTRMQHKVRGSSTEGLPKKQYRVELWDGAMDADGDQVLLGMPADSDFILNNPYTFDKALMRNAIVYELSNKIGRWAPRTRFVEVFMTDTGRAVTMADYMGVYMLIEVIKSKKTRVNITDLGPTDNDNPAVTGGYIFKVDRLNVGEKGLVAGAGPMNRWTSACPFQQFAICPLTLPLALDEPSDMLMTATQRTYLTNILNAFANDLGAGKYEDHIDVDSWIDHHILNVFTKNPDAFRLSTYLHKNRGGKLVAGPVWDFDRTLGCTSDVRCNDPMLWDAQIQTADTTNVFNYGWWRGLFAIPAFRTAYFARFKQLLGNELDTPSVHAVVDKLSADLGTEAPTRNFAKWPEDRPAPGHPAEVMRMKDWMARRVTWLKKCLDQPDPLKCGAL